MGLLKTCLDSGQRFTVDDCDLEFYQRVSPEFAGRKFLIPPPSRAPLQRLRRRFSYRNQIYLFQRHDAKRRSFFSIFPESAPFPVVPNEEWWSDSWDALSYGREFDFSRPFFEQYFALRSQVPHMARHGINLENSEYSSNASEIKNCYLVFNTSRTIDCQYCENVWGSQDCMQCTQTRESELCYDCVACEKCYNLQSSQDCIACADSYYLLGCKSCRKCFGCVNLRHKEYHLFNQPCSVENYDTFIAAQALDSYAARQMLAQRVCSFWQQHPRPHEIQQQTEACSGHYIYHSKNVRDSFLVSHGQDLRYCQLAYDGCKDCYDYSIPGLNAELVYEALMCGVNAQSIIGCVFSIGCSNLFYSSYCVYCRDCFGCVGLKHKQYCIFNRQYSAEEYTTLAARIAQHMQASAEWGEFFPEQMSPIPYNYSLAQRYFPLDQERAEAQGLGWEPQRVAAQSEKGAGISSIPDRSRDVTGAYTAVSELSQRPFRVTQSEIDIAKQRGFPLPRITYDEAMQQRAELMGGAQLFEHTSAKTGNKLLSPLPPDQSWLLWEREEYEREFA
jgi:hypothetical protein